MGTGRGARKSMRQRLSKLPFSKLPQWNPKYGCKGTVTTRFALIALVAWHEEAFCAPKVRLKWYGFKGFPSHSSHCSGGLFPQYSGVSPLPFSFSPKWLFSQVPSAPPEFPLTSSAGRCKGPF